MSSILKQAVSTVLHGDVPEGPYHQDPRDMPHDRDIEDMPYRDWGEDDNDDEVIDDSEVIDDDAHGPRRGPRRDYCPYAEGALSNEVEIATAEADAAIDAAIAMTDVYLKVMSDIENNGVNREMVLSMESIMDENYITDEHPINGFTEARTMFGKDLAMEGIIKGTLDVLQKAGKAIWEAIEKALAVTTKYLKRLFGKDPKPVTIGAKEELTTTPDATAKWKETFNTEYYEWVERNAVPILNNDTLLVEIKKSAEKILAVANHLADGSAKFRAAVHKNDIVGSSNVQKDLLTVLRGYINDQWEMPGLLDSFIGIPFDRAKDKPFDIEKDSPRPFNGYVNVKSFTDKVSEMGRTARSNDIAIDFRGIRSALTDSGKSEMGNDLIALSDKIGKDFGKVFAKYQKEAPDEGDIQHDSVYVEALALQTRSLNRYQNIAATKLNQHLNALTRLMHTRAMMANAAAAMHATVVEEELDKL